MELKLPSTLMVFLLKFGNLVYYENVIIQENHGKNHFEDRLLIDSLFGAGNGVQL